MAKKSTRAWLCILSTLCLFPTCCWAWGQDGHSIIAEIAQRRLTPQAAAEVARLLGASHSLASVGSWADDVRDQRPESYNWHFVDIPVAEDHYDAVKHCAPSEKGDCIIAELDRLKGQLRCAPTDEAKREALKYTVHFVGDIHQPMHTVDEARGGNDIAIEVRMAGGKTCRGGPCPIRNYRSNFHALWDSGLIQATTWSWGAYVERLEAGPLSKAGPGDPGGSIIDWAEGTHAAARIVWNALPATRVVNDEYYQTVRPILDNQLVLAGLRLARFLNEAYETTNCPAR